VEGERHTLSEEDLLLVNLNRRHSLSVPEDALACRLHIPYALLRRYVNRENILFWCDSTAERSEYHLNLRVLLRQMLSSLIARPGGGRI
jgi:hypothetical protein